MILNGLLWKWTEIILSFLRLDPSTAFRTLVDYDGYSISSKVSSELNSPIPVHFSWLIPRMSTFILAISCLTTSNLPWFMDLTFQVPMHCCSLRYQTLLPSPVTSTMGVVFSLALSLHSSWSYFSTLLPVAYWVPTDLGRSSFSVISFCLFILFMEFSRQECWSGFPSPSPVDHILTELSMTHLSWMALHSMAHSFIELDKAVIQCDQFG